MPRCSRSFSAYDHFLSLCYAQLTYRESLRDIIICLSARPPLQYRMGFRGRVTRTNLAYANEKRDWRVFAAVADVLMRRARKLYQNDLNQGQLPELAFALDRIDHSSECSVISLGVLGQIQSRGSQIAYAAGLKRKHPCLGADYRSFIPGDENSGPNSGPSRCVLRHGPRVSGF